jgi:nucleoside-diphosphate-sugar epimerase
MKVLIVGGSSAIASVLKPTLMSIAEVITAGRSGCDIELDLAWQDDKFVLPQGIDVVMNLVAHFGGKDFEGIFGAEKINVLGMLSLCRAAKLAGVSHLIQVSTIFAGLPENSEFFSSYALSKRNAEDVARLYCSSVDLPLTVLRPTQIYGVGEAFRKHQPFLYNIVDKVEQNQDVVFYGTNDAQRNLLHVEDMAEIMLRVVKQRVLGHFICPAMVNTRYSEVASAAISAFESASKYSFDADKPDIPDNAFFFDETLYRKIGFMPNVSIVQGMQKEQAYRRGVQ